MTLVTKSAEQEVERWFRALETGNPEHLIALYAEDSLLLPTLRGDVRIGHQPIRNYFVEVFLPRNPIGRMVELHSRLIGEYAVNSGLYEFEVDGGETGRRTAEARFTFVYQWRDGDWKIIEHHSSLNPEDHPVNRS